MDLLLLSNSANYGQQLYAHTAAEFAQVADGQRVAFVPFALADWDGYGNRAVEALAAIDIDAWSVHHSDDAARSILEADVILMGGGNSFRLLDTLIGLGVVGELRQRILDGRCRYLAASAGTNMACPSLRTTNDMPICHPPSFETMALVPFQINLHYVDADPASTFMGETRDERIAEFLEENDCPVLALYEGSWLRIRGRTAMVHGPGRLFDRSGATALPDGSDVSELLDGVPRFDRGRRPRLPRTR